MELGFDHYTERKPTIYPYRFFDFFALPGKAERNGIPFLRFFIFFPGIMALHRRGVAG